MLVPVRVRVVQSLLQSYRVGGTQSPTSLLSSSCSASNKSTFSSEGQGVYAAGGSTVAAFFERVRCYGVSLQQAVDFGQPSPGTHPELLATDEVTPGISAAEYGARRAALLSVLPPNSAAILPAAPIAYMAGVIPYPYRQSADFLYLTGCQQPGSVAVLEKRGGADETRFAMFMPQRDVTREWWDGPLANEVAARQLFRADDAHRLDQLDAHIGSLLTSRTAIYFDGRKSQEGGLHQSVPKLGQAREQGLVRPLRPIMHTLRWRKSDAEIRRMRAVSAVTAAAFKESMRSSRVSLHEHTIAATFEYECKRRGAQRMAYPPVVGAGPNGCYIHYSRHDRQVRPGELVTMDAGCELHGYASDVTRAWPVSGRFSPEQSRVYSAVLSVWHACLALCRPGRTLHEIHATSVRLLSAAMADFGAPLKARLPFVQPHARFYAHYIGHWLGMDTHDCATVSQTTPLQPGVVLAVEPGLYFPDQPDIPAWLRGIGIRIEDDILITEGDPEVLSSEIPRKIEDIEHFLQE